MKGKAGTIGGILPLMAKCDRKFSKSFKNPKTDKKTTVRYGAQGYSIAPGTSKRGLILRTF